MPNQNYIFANTINGNPLYADRAEHDADGNLISTTYATKAELPEGVPAVTSSDDGKVLQASYSGGTGSVSWVTPGGGGTTEVFFATPGTTTYAEILAAASAGKTVVARLYDSGTGWESYMDYYLDTINEQSTPANSLILFSRVVWIDTGTETTSVFNLEGCTVSGTNVWSYFTRKCSFPELSNPSTGSGYALTMHATGSTQGLWYPEWAKIDAVPAVTSSDDGKVLTADYTGGVASYSWETPSGGGGSRIVELTVGTSTWSDFTTAYAQLTAGTIDGIRAKATGSAGDYYADLVDVDKAFGGMPIGANFSAPSYSVSSSGIDGRRISSKLYNLSSTGVWTTTTHKALTSDIVAGTGVSVSTDSSYNIVVALSTTAGITDIQQVASLPASPVSTVLYLIPET